MPFDPQPTLTGTLLELRPLRTEGYDALYADPRGRESVVYQIARDAPPR